MIERLMRQFSYVMHACHDRASDETVQLHGTCLSDETVQLRDSCPS
jgi:hypothetical protein